MRTFERSRVSGLLRFLAGFVGWCAGFFLIFVKQSDFLSSSKVGYVVWFNANKINIGVYLLIVQAATQVILTALAFLRPKFDKKKVSKVLNSIAELQFGETDSGKYEYRATLFKERWAPFLGSWLGVVARSGDKYRRMRSIFSVDRNDRTRNSGIVGECWWRGTTIVKSVPPIPEELQDETDRCLDYKRETFLADQEFDGLTVRACVYIATCIKIDGETWGVLVLDTTDPSKDPGTKKSKQLTESLKHGATTLSQLLS